MDGIETTQLIRKHGTEYAQTIPIIALTANAVAGNEQMFLNEGFQAFVSKPISVIKLDKVIRDWIMTGEPAPAEPAPAELSLYEDDMDMLIDVMRSFSDNIPNELACMKNLTEDNLADYAIDIHTLKGASSSIGAKDLTVRAKKMERMAKAGDLAGVLEVNEKFIEDALRLVENIKTWLKSR
jgi:CheY-like chemotaxis protein